MLRPLHADPRKLPRTDKSEGLATSTTEDANMPPKKKSRAPPRATSTPVTDDDAMVVDSPAAETPKPIDEPAKRNELLDDPWSDEQETSLFKGIMRWKPNGIYICYIHGLRF
jgi:hypothetical protein